jgi:fructose-specific phosphotransferase system IIA component
MDNRQIYLDEVLNQATINLDLKVNDRKESIEALADLLSADKRILDREVFIEDVLARETIETTNMGIGVAIPHGKSSAVARNSIAIGRVAKPIEWDPEKDEKPVTVVFLLAVRDDAAKDKVHIEMISKVATLLVKEAFLDVLFKTNDKEVLLENIYKLIGE